MPGLEDSPRIPRRYFLARLKAVPLRFPPLSGRSLFSALVTSHRPSFSLSRSRGTRIRDRKGGFDSQGLNTKSSKRSAGSAEWKKIRKAPPSLFPRYLLARPKAVSVRFPRSLGDLFFLSLVLCFPLRGERRLGIGHRHDGLDRLACEVVGFFTLFKAVSVRFPRFLGDLFFRPLFFTFPFAGNEDSGSGIEMTGSIAWHSKSSSESLPCSRPCRCVSPAFSAISFFEPCSCFPLRGEPRLGIGHRNDGLDRLACEVVGFFTLFKAVSVRFPRFLGDLFFRPLFFTFPFAGNEDSGSGIEMTGSIAWHSKSSSESLPCSMRTRRDPKGWRVCRRRSSPGVDSLRNRSPKRDAKRGAKRGSKPPAGIEESSKDRSEGGLGRLPDRSMRASLVRGLNRDRHIRCRARWHHAPSCGCETKPRALAATSRCAGSPPARPER